MTNKDKLIEFATNWWAQELKKPVPEKFWYSEKSFRMDIEKEKQRLSLTKVELDKFKDFLKKYLQTILFKSNTCSLQTYSSKSNIIESVLIDACIESGISTMVLPDKKIMMLIDAKLNQISLINFLNRKIIFSEN